jgi:hypothetical protein
MDRARIIAAYRIGFAILAVVAIVYQGAILIGDGTFQPTRFFAYFTIQSNLIAVVVFLIGATRVRSGRSRAWELVRGGAVLYMTVTLVVYNTLLATVDVSTQSWVNDVVHKLFPVVVIADWLVDPPAMRLAFRDTLVWLVYPLMWTGLTVVRGALDGWYPYPFLDPANGGYGTVAAYVVGILAFGLVLCAIIAAVGNALGARRADVAPAPA